MAEWLSNWTWNPKGLSRRFKPCSQHSISFFRNILRKVGNTNYLLCSQTTETDEQKNPISICWEIHIDCSVWKRPARQFPAKNRREVQALNWPQTQKKIHQTEEYTYFPRGVMAEWFRSWTWNRKRFSRRFEPCSHRSISTSRNISRKVGNTNQKLCSQYGLSAILEQSDWRWHSTANIWSLLQSSLSLQIQCNFKQKTVNIFSVTSYFGGLERSLFSQTIGFRAASNN